ncbi:MAG TPA: electron transport complex subunit RsxA, partial [Firmicutes bacterium]|nr:electron transport complex subunit RsxA [Bacillota bacterium]
MALGSLFIIAISAIFINNFVLIKFLGICPFMGVSKKIDSALGMGGAVIFVMTIASAVTWTVQKYVLDKYDLKYLQTIVFIVVIASLVQFIEMFLQKSIPDLYKALGIFLPLITTNCAILGVTIMNITEKYSFIGAVVNGLSAGIGFTLA